MAYDSRGVGDFRASGVHAALLRADRHYRSHHSRPEFGASRLFGRRSRTADHSILSRSHGHAARIDAHVPRQLAGRARRCTPPDGTLDAQALRLAAKAESIRMQQAYVSFKTLYWRAKAEGRDEEAQQLIEENRNIIEQVKRLQTDVKQ